MKKKKKRRTEISGVNFVPLMKATLRILGTQYNTHFNPDIFDFNLGRDFTQLDLYYAVRAIATLINHQNRVCAGVFPQGPHLHVSHTDLPPLKASWLADFLHRAIQSKLQGLVGDSPSEQKLGEDMQFAQAAHILALFVRTVAAIPPLIAEQIAADAMARKQAEMMATSLTSKDII